MARMVDGSRGPSRRRRAIMSPMSPTRRHVAARALRRAARPPRAARAAADQRRATCYLVGGAVRDLMLGAEPRRSGSRGRRRARARARRCWAADCACTTASARATVKLDGFATTSRAPAGRRYRAPGRAPERRARGPRAGPAPPRLHRQRHRAGAAGSEPRRAVTAPGRARGPRRSGGCACCTTRSFIDDPTRLLRLARYAGAAGLPVEPHTLELARAARGRRRSGHGQRRAARRRAAAAGRQSRSGGRLLAAARARHRRGAGTRLRPASTPTLGPPRAGAAAARRRPRRSCWRAAGDVVAPGASWPQLLERLAFAARTRRDPGRGRRAAALARRASAAPRGPRRSPAAVGRRRPELVGARRRARPAERRPASGWISCATCGSRSTGATCWRPGCRPVRRSARACARRWPQSSTGAPRAARPSSP